MSQFSARYPTLNVKQEKKIAISEIGRDFKFYTPTPGFEESGLAFRVAYAASKKYSNDRELCAYVGSMLCSVSNYLKPSVIEALHEVGVEPCFVYLPCHAREFGIDQAQVHQMDWPSILVHFAGIICMLLMKKYTCHVGYQVFMSNCIRDLQTRVGDKTNIQLNDVPFNFYSAHSIRTMLGASLTLRTSVIQTIMVNMYQGPPSIRSVFQYLFDTFSWSGMEELKLLNEMLVFPQSDVLLDPQHSSEVGNLHEAVAAVQSHRYPQFFMLLASNEELMKVDYRSRFPTLIEIAKRMAL